MEVLKAGNEMPPIRVAIVNDAPVLIDGWHRVAAMEQLNYRDAEAIVQQATEKEAFWLAAKANLEHGLPLRKSEMRGVFRAYVKARQHLKSHTEYKSYREMQKDLSIPHTTIRNWMIKDFRHIAAKMGGDDEFKGKGGLREEFPPSAIEASAMQGLDQAFQAFQSTANPELRGQIIHRMDYLLGEMRKAGKWEAWGF